MKFETNWIASFHTVTCLVSLISRKSQDEKTTYNGLSMHSVISFAVCKAWKSLNSSVACYVHTILLS